MALTAMVGATRRQSHGERIIQDQEQNNAAKVITFDRRASTVAPGTTSWRRRLC
ncbi:hypothetical protein [Peristeroidobacter agariperforans]|uniref:hypothetical protein n=1 Tax=Peristeroidobacter agariperforans TaxID=268404 RepID=UPI00130057F2|nr:hypothetical protein [Peristeroidobacter agariperforans]